jgi:hypothetical protein
MHLKIALIEYTAWKDPRLAYANNSDVPKYFKDSRIDMSESKDGIWLPKISYTEENDIDIISESLYLYPNGTLNYYRKFLLTITCEFNY